MITGQFFFNIGIPLKSEKKNHGRKVSEGHEQTVDQEEIQMNKKKALKII